MIEDKRNSEIVFGCLMLTASPISFFQLFVPPWPHLQAKQGLHLHNLPLPHFPAILVSYNRHLQVSRFLQFSSTKLGLTFKSTAELHFFGWTQIGISFSLCKARRLNRTLRRTFDYEKKKNGTEHFLKAF